MVFVFAFDNFQDGKKEFIHHVDIQPVLKHAGTFIELTKWNIQMPYMCAHVCVLCKGYAENCCLTLPKTYVTANCRNIYSAWPWRQFKFKRNNPQVKSSSRLTGEREEEKRKKERNCNEDKERWELKCIPYVRSLQMQIYCGWVGTIYSVVASICNVYVQRTHTYMHAYRCWIARIRAVQRKHLFSFWIRF